MPFMGWTAVVPLHNRAVLMDNLEKLAASNDSKHDNDNQIVNLVQQLAVLKASPGFKKCNFAGHEVYCLTGEVIVPTFCITDRELVMTLSVPAMKAYLARKERRSLATLSNVKLALDEVNPPSALGYCDTPRVFSLLYPVFSLYASLGSTAAQKMDVELDPTFWPSAPSIRPHLCPDITTLKRTPHGLELTCRYCLPTGGINGPLWLIALAGGGQDIAFANFMHQPISVPDTDNSPPGSRPAVNCPKDPNVLAPPSPPDTVPGVEPAWGNSDAPLSPPPGMLKRLRRRCRDPMLRHGAQRAAMCKPGRRRGTGVE